jgi:hypothetical protein
MLQFEAIPPKQQDSKNAKSETCGLDSRLCGQFSRRNRGPW